MTVGSGVFVDGSMVVLGGLFIVGSMAKSLRLGRRAPGTPATPIFRVLLFLFGLTTLIEGIRHLVS